MRSVWVQSLFGLIACEALVQLWFDAAPLQPIRRVLIRLTPWLQANDTHLFNCKYCVSVWVAAFLVGLLAYNEVAFFWFAGVFAIHRSANILHLLVSYVRDLQMDLRIERGKGKR